MKKLLSIILVFLLSVSLLGCSSDNEYVGKYILSSIEINNNVYVEGDDEWKTILGMNVPGENIYIKLEDNGNMEYVITTTIKKGTWSIDESIITMTIDNYEEKATYEDERLILVNVQKAVLVFEKIK